MSTLLKSTEVPVSDLHYITAEDAIRCFKDGTLSPVDLMKAVIERCERVNPLVNAITNRFYEQALEKAEQAAERYRTGNNLRPLEGIPLAVKELHPVEGITTSWGSKIFEGVPADRTLPAVQRLLDAGAIMHIRTTTPEFAHCGHCHSPLYGVTRNPWNQEYSSGGSSGGAGVTVAAGMTTLAEGDDGGGSIRMPSSMCGIVGYKPSYGRVPGLLLDTMFESIVHIGPMTRSVDDAALMMNVMSGQHPDDITSLRDSVKIPGAAGTSSFKGVRVAFSPDLGYFEIDPEVARNTRRAVESMAAAGAIVEEVELGWTDIVYDAWVTHWEGLLATLAHQHVPEWQYKMDPFVRKLIHKGMSHGAIRVKQTEMVRSKMWKDLSPILSRNQVLVTPTIALPALKAQHQNDDPNFNINGKPVDAFLNWALTYPFNLLSQCPAFSLPSGFSSAGVPTGIQFVGRPFDDAGIFQVARAFEAVAHWSATHPDL
ncbi:Aspartyl-tRNA(Asn) amidotransferase subunit A Glutamyl-tRNA(Gln) amidotransferase subunit A [Paraburkholderia caribensis MBA4]|uniref:Aspartyl-tRNA(Asn) amidotransferase subunit A Glutamyl-tRNA(Gln) amidotransferase subunit A n=1 Tax=Paraburkholderia caribensis MBA4 TaxID=1323664 RepID=A0A0P0RHV4_9BURK|nr:amidase [Paraburkholderia caribensis]ALL68318.1 Aspartyl-tRNA(Asn) amidotransferase subunit A Glutamyl-tRNA(Gln) amidotransferase subunit A [Paraburkholderia caribensis MBA4]